jgi:hypothetical protein
LLSSASSFSFSLSAESDSAEEEDDSDDEERWGADAEGVMITDAGVPGPTARIIFCNRDGFLENYITE